MTSEKSPPFLGTLIWDLTHIPKNKIKKNTFGGDEVGGSIKSSTISQSKS